MKLYQAQNLVETMEQPMEMAVSAFISRKNANNRTNAVDLTMKIGGGSYTNFDSIVVALNEDMIEETVDKMKEDLQKGIQMGQIDSEKEEFIKKHIKVTEEISKNTTLKDAEVELFAISAHETGHVLFTSIAKMKEFLKDVSDDLAKDGIHKKVAERYAKYLDNILEDGRIEFLMAQHFLGTLKAFQFLNSRMYETSILYEDYGLLADSDYKDLMNGLLTLTKSGLMPYNESRYNKDIIDTLNTVKPLIKNVIHAKNPALANEAKFKVHEHIRPLILQQLKEESKDMEQFEQLMDMLEDLINNAPSGNDDGEPLDNSEDQSKGGNGMTITVHISPDVEESDGQGQSQEDSDENQDQKQGQGQGQGQDEESKEENEKSKGAGEGEDEDKEKDGNKGDNSEEDEDSKNKDSKDGNGNNKTSKPNKKDADKKKEALKKLIEDTKADSRASVDIPRKRKEVPLQTQDSPSGESAASGIVGDFSLDQRNTFVEHQRNFKILNLPNELEFEINKLKSVVDEFYSRPDFNLRNRPSGIIDPRRLTSVKFHDYDVFQRVGHKSQMDPVIYIAWDGSGSMYGGQKQRESARACAVIEGAFAEYMPIKIINFQTGFNATEHYLVKEFEEVADDNKSFSYSYGQYNNFGGGNNDGMSIRVATEELMLRPESDKILIVLSDGMPTSYSYKSPEEDVKRVVKEAKEKGIHVVPVFFGSNEFRDQHAETYKYMYQDNLINSSVDKITDNLIMVFKNILL